MSGSSEKSKMRFLKKIVLFCITFTALTAIAEYVAAWFGVDTSSVTTAVYAVYGGELLLSAVLRLSEKDKKGE
jgi:hypothetical protein